MVVVSEYHVESTRDPEREDETPKGVRSRFCVCWRLGKFVDAIRAWRSYQTERSQIVEQRFEIVPAIERGSRINVIEGDTVVAAISDRNLVKPPTSGRNRLNPEPRSAHSYPYTPKPPLRRPSMQQPHGLGFRTAPSARIELATPGLGNCSSGSAIYGYRRTSHTHQGFWACTILR
jgi:hypothetical protein